MKHVLIRATLILALAAVAVLSGCQKAQVAATVPPPPPPSAPTASLAATPGAIEKGQSSTLKWQTSSANDVTIDAVGVTTQTLGLLQPNGSLEVTPSDSTTYILYAKGPGGKESASARVTVTVPAQPAAVTKPSEDELFARNVRDIYFDFDKTDIRVDQQAVLERDAAFLRQHSNVSLTVEGHCDERGSIEYNLALGDKRANTVKEMLQAGGIPSRRVRTISYGKEKPVCDAHDEACWQQNRRGHFAR